MLIKINGGTVQSAEPLCKSCHYFWLRTAGNGEQIAKCMMSGWERGGVPMDQLYYECNRYEDSKRTKHDLFWKSAWILQTNKSGLPVGFVKNKDYRNANPDDPDFKYR